MSNDSKSTPKAVAVSQETKDKAFAIFQELSIHSHGVTHEQLAIESFRRAAAFQRISEQVDAGSVSTDTPVEPPREMVKVRMMRAKNDWSGFEEVIDPNTKQPIEREFPADPYAYCPNAPADHPANQRFKPREGDDFATRAAAFKRTMKIGA